MIPADVLKFPGRVDRPESVGFAPFRVLVSSVGITPTEGSRYRMSPRANGRQWGPEPAKSAPPFLRAPPQPPLFRRMFEPTGTNREKTTRPRFNII